MAIDINFTHDPARRSWLASANDPETDFPIQNLPFGVFAHAGEERVGVALGDCIIDMGRLVESGALSGDAAEGARAASGSSLAPLLIAAPRILTALRARLSTLYSADSQNAREPLQAALVPIEHTEMRMPLRPSAFTDFCSSYEHIRRMGGGPPKGAPLWLPVAYNGRSSSVQVSGTKVVRPWGQFEVPPGSNQVRFGPEPMLDFELEFGVWLRGGNALGETVDIAQAENLMFGCCLVNDWSARAIQFFESMLGPHLGKSFLTTISPWIVTMEALAPFRVAARGRAVGEPAIPAHLHCEEDRSNGAFSVELTAELSSPDTAPTMITRTNLSELYWTPAQMVAHQASNGAPLEAGDLVATGTVSGAAQSARACLAEITLRGGEEILLADGSKRKMLNDGDSIALRGRAVAPGYVPIGFGPCVGTIQPARLR